MPVLSNTSANTLSQFYTGHCLCGGIHYEVTGPLNDIQVCHCSMCRRAYGGPLATITPVQSKDFHLLAGAELLDPYEATPGKKRYSCRRCHSPIYSQRDASPDMLRLRVGTLDTPLPIRPVVNFYMAAAANWWPVTDSLPQYPGDLPPEIKQGTRTSPPADRASP